MNCIRKPTNPLKMTAPAKPSILEQALKGSFFSSTESLLDVATPLSPLSSPTRPSKPVLSLRLKSTKPSSHLRSTPPFQDQVAKSSQLQQEPPSEKFLQLQELRKRCQASRTPCSYVFKKGDKKGQKCSRASGISSVLCPQHRSQARSAHSKPTTQHPVKTIRINRLKRGKRYFFVRVLYHHKVKLICDDVHYILKLPYGMLHPEHPSHRHYLIRNDNGDVEWKQSPMCTTG